MTIILADFSQNGNRRGKVGLAVKIMPLTTVQRLHIYFLSIGVVVIILGLALNFNAWIKAKDVLTLNQIKTLAYALERYHQDYWRYPDGRGVDLRQEAVVSENGLARGAVTYYQGQVESLRDVRYSSDGQSYQISFSLNESWPESGLVGKKCLVTAGYHVDCSAP